MAGSSERINKGETIGDIAAQQEITRLQDMWRSVGLTMGETPATQLALQGLQQEIRGRIEPVLGAIADHQIAAEDLVQPGDMALFLLPSGSVFEKIESVGSESVRGPYGSTRLDLTIVLTKGGQVLVGRELIEKSATATSSGPVK
ncbi:hypothetical protein M1437_00260 [Patescibacteria group bacterium]|nr:hypothetical protein [Patescibacteria group bacterium]